MSGNGTIEHYRQSVEAHLRAGYGRDLASLGGNGARTQDEVDMVIKAYLRAGTSAEECGTTLMNKVAQQAGYESLSAYQNRYQTALEEFAGAYGFPLDAHGHVVIPVEDGGVHLYAGSDGFIVSRDGSEPAKAFDIGDALQAFAFKNSQACLMANLQLAKEAEASGPALGR